MKEPYRGAVSQDVDKTEEVRSALHIREPGGNRIESDRFRMVQISRNDLIVSLNTDQTPLKIVGTSQIHCCGSQILC
jgi:hypothetical protein